ncbi:MAG: hypothetical protein JW839_01715 [Candidatus Lokiarchaeota archaeon]|nr:hypothetical protein [Candidatus Lokiarchaeota archaeon]
MKTIHFVIWASPLATFLGFFLTRWIVAAWSIEPAVGAGALGYGFLVAGFFVLLGLLVKHSLFQLIFSIAFIVVSLAPITLYIGCYAQAYTLAFMGTVFMDAVAVYNIVDCARKKGGARNWVLMRKAFWAVFKNKEARGMKAARKRLLAGLIVLTGLYGSMGFLIAAPFYADKAPRIFTITDAQSEDYELFVYFPDYAAINDTICDIFDEVNATLSFPLTEDRFAVGDAGGDLAANRTALLNARGIKVEVWPLFEWDEGSYPSISEIDRWPVLYEKFHNWTVRNAITVDYMMWDIESGGELGMGNGDIEDWIQPFKVIAEHGRNSLRIKQLDEVWGESLATIRALGERCRADGHLMGTTTHTIIEDLFDGDADGQKLSGLPVWDAADAFDFISMMVYRGCEWGGEPATADYVYDYTRMNALVNNQPGDTVAVCLGCINYTPYPNVTSVVSDVHLALAAGANMIRLFQANSWINGVGTWQNPNGNWVYGGPAHGVSGLRDLLLACRVGGTATYQPTAGRRQALLSSVAYDVLFDLGKPF